jgi:F-type H+-transporting ATPase subunit c
VTERVAFVRERPPGDTSLVTSPSEEAPVVKKFVIVIGLVLVAGLLTPLYAQEGGEAAGGVLNADVLKWAIATAGFGLGIAAAGGALGQGRAVAAAAEGIARNPGAADQIRGVTILGLVLIESLVIYVLLISLLIFFGTPPFI